MLPCSKYKRDWSMNYYQRVVMAFKITCTKLESISTEDGGAMALTFKLTCQDHAANKHLSSLTLPFFPLTCWSADKKLSSHMGPCSQNIWQQSVELLFRIMKLHPSSTFGDEKVYKLHIYGSEQCFLRVLNPTVRRPLTPVFNSASVICEMRLLNMFSS